MLPDQQGPVGPQPSSDSSGYRLPDCYRHPGRETGVSCTRCERPVCPECRVSASVGFHCRECVQGGQASVRAPRTEFGGRAVRDRALVTKILIGINVVVWGLQYLISSTALDHLYMQGQLVGQGQWYRMITSVFFHTAILHIGMNMWSLWVIGPALEQLLGRWRYLGLYLVSGLAGSALQLIVAPDVWALGASGAIFGLLGALVALQRKRGYQLGPILAIIFVNLLATFAIPGISWEAHVGGLVAGAVIGFGLAHAPERNRALVQWGTMALTLGVVLVLSLIGVAQLPG
ncbi:rhomboid family intramembrane serine protease [Streptacidiphilus sp. P02-A3a]|uniref:rhomboid family intramembrane serine protease n=1 Tax=Streptacidiphilus sp. P02-A3a TaxID=2704468 RepID=UPI0015FC3F89|nr:rhomboid family intramembrane serine protease [Streptacidiphilus sp. P02-A3a]QMU66850.1 rhomboid family intramembrane serine protease [Streptacidiphilus sp. P02-A3a]